MKRRYYETAAVFFLILLALAPMWQWVDPRIPQTHDFDLQAARIASFSQGLKEGNIFPRWGGNLNWGYGHPSLMFLYPLTSYVGGVLAILGLSFVQATKLTFGLTAVLAAVGMYLFLRGIFSQKAAVAGTVLYLLAPYRLVDINVRGALGELAGLAVIPWTLWRFWELINRPSRRNVGWAGITIFLLILAHNAVGLMGLGMLVVWLGGLMLSRYRSGQALRFAQGGLRRQQSHSQISPTSITFRSRNVMLASIGLGFGLAAFYWLPAVIEGKYTFQKEFTNLEIYTSRFPAMKELIFSSWGYGGTSEAGRPAGFTVSVGWAALAAAAVLLRSLLKNTYGLSNLQRATAVSFLIIFVTGIFFLTPISIPLVSKLGIIQRFQFPWRFLAMTTVAGAVTAAAVIETMGRRWIWLVGFLGLVAVWQSGPGMFIQGYEDLNPANETFSGPAAWTSDTGESTPRWATRFQDHYPKSELEVVWGADITYETLERKQELHRYLVEATVPTQVVDNTLYFPGWRVEVNGAEAPIEYQDQNWRGLITFPVPVGRSEVVVEFLQTRVRKAAAAVSVVNFAILAALLRKAL